MLTHIQIGRKDRSIFLNDKKFFPKISGLYARFLKISTLIYYEFSLIYAKAAPIAVRYSAYGGIWKRTW